MPSTKRELENRFTSWVNDDNNRKAIYGNVLKDMENALSVTNQYDYLRIYTNEAILRGTSAATIARSFRALENELKANGNSAKAEAIILLLKSNLDKIFKDYNYSTEEKLLAAGLEVFFQNVPLKQQNTDFLDYAFKMSYDFKKISNDIFSKSNMTSAEKVNKLLENPTYNDIVNDPLYILINQFTIDLYIKMYFSRSLQY